LHIIDLFFFLLYRNNFDFKVLFDWDFNKLLFIENLERKPLALAGG